MKQILAHLFNSVHLRMGSPIGQLQQLTGSTNNPADHSVLNDKIRLFESDNHLQIPEDLADYFRVLEQAKHGPDIDMYELYGFDRFKSVTNELAQWGGIPNYRNIIHTLPDPHTCFVFADYMMHLLAYAIRLHPVQAPNEIYLICGDKYKIVGHSFTEFLELYLVNSFELQDI